MDKSARAKRRDAERKGTVGGPVQSVYKGRVLYIGELDRASVGRLMSYK